VARANYRRFTFPLADTAPISQLSRRSVGRGPFGALMPLELERQQLADSVAKYAEEVASQ
jgi:hypothetical protein